MSFDNSSNPPGWVWTDLNRAAVVNNLITVAFCIIINYVNAAMVHTFLKHEVRNLYESTWNYIGYYFSANDTIVLSCVWNCYSIFKATPRYILFIHLVINDIILMTLLTFLQMLSYIIFFLNVSLCIVLVLLATAANYNTQMTLAVMSLECYIAVCYPLRHSQICTVKKTYIVIACIWLINALDLLPDVFIALATEPLEFFHSRAYCDKDRVLRHSYSIEKDTIFDAVVMALVWLTLIYTYLSILFTAKSAAADARKARNTVLLHSFQLLLSMLTYVYFLILRPLQSLFPSSRRAIRFALVVFINIMPRIISPLLYGLRDKNFRKYLKQHVFCAKEI